VHRKRCRNQSRSSSSSRAISVIVTRSCGHIFLPRRGRALPIWPRRALLPPARLCRRPRDPAAAAAVCARLCLWIPTSYFHLQLWFCQLLYTICRLSIRYPLGLKIEVTYIMYKGISMKGTLQFVNQEPRNNKPLFGNCWKLLVSSQ
jgi:hypothetical protein